LGVPGETVFFWQDFGLVHSFYVGGGVLLSIAETSVI
jgi:hypothetical protein